MVKYDLDLGDIAWATELDSTAAAGAPLIDNWGQVIFRYSFCQKFRFFAKISSFLNAVLHHCRGCVSN